MPEIHKDIVVNSILENSTLGFAYELQALFYLVWYLILARGKQIRFCFNEFPRRIPSWFNRDDIRNPKYVILDEKGEPTRQWIVDIWRFDAEPFDFIIFTYDPILKCTADAYLVSIKKDNKRYLGMAGKRYIAGIAGCLHYGRTYDWVELPKHTFKPILIMGGVQDDKIFKFADKMNCELFYTSRFQKVIDYCKEHGKVYSDDKVLNGLREEFELMEKYEHHEDVVLGRITAEQLVKLRSKYGTHS